MTDRLSQTDEILMDQVGHVDSFVGWGGQRTRDRLGAAQPSRPLLPDGAITDKNEFSSHDQRKQQSVSTGGEPQGQRADCGGGANDHCAEGLTPAQVSSTGC